MINTMDELFLHTLKDIYYAENQILKTLPKLAKKASSEKLAQAMEKHRAETEQQIDRLEQVFKILGKKPEGVKCAAIEGILKEGEEILSEVKDPQVRDAGMLASAQAVEHYEITRYGTLIAWGEQLKLKDVCKLLQQNLDEEKKTDASLSKLAESNLNKQAAAA
jgi:ferritin-like metal-binding protein YciE